jgi:hypothetical protein
VWDDADERDWPLSVQSSIAFRNLISDITGIDESMPLYGL